MFWSFAKRRAFGPARKELTIAGVEIFRTESIAGGFYCMGAGFPFLFFFFSFFGGEIFTYSSENIDFRMQELCHGPHGRDS